MSSRSISRSTVVASPLAQSDAAASPLPDELDDEVELFVRAARSSSFREIFLNVTASEETGTPTIPTGNGETASKPRLISERIDTDGFSDEYAAFRERYLGWRLRKGAGPAVHASVSDGAGMHHRIAALVRRAKHPGGFGYWYPTMQEWQWRRTLSYWIAVTFFEGSLFFSISSFLWCYADDFGRLHRWVTTWGYVAGKAHFFVCTYFMCIETINLSGEEGKHGGPSDDSSGSSSDSDDNGKKHDPDEFHFYPFHCKKAVRNLNKLGAGPWPYFASVIYFIGVLVFAVALIMDFIPSIPEQVSEPVIRLLFLFGSLFFFVGGLFECIENEAFYLARWVRCEFDQGLVGAVLNTTGGLGFVVGAIIAYIPGHTYASLFSYGVGSVIFAAGSGVMILMWKDEQFGLTFLAVLNHLGGDNGKPMVVTPCKSKVEEKATFSYAGAIFIMIYCLAGCLSTYDFYISLDDIWTTDIDTSKILERSFNSLLPCAFAHMMLALNSGVVQTPKQAPFRQLYIGCRILALLMCLNSGARFYSALKADAALTHTKEIGI
eukprot:TRINITY_DN19260_c0_g1_i1.p1 TRINITY_DN19260_c0_g1~~TRINITY_DN19260_c0_g1_i1.p1  ORF type:complete len:548 (+),score=64.27 TRINITY_DN19260_c0_g1_i1:95-1738(+)